MNVTCKPNSRSVIGRGGEDSDLDRDAARLLSALGREGAYAIDDPLTEDGILVRGGGNGVSLGSGRLPRNAGDALVNRDLAERDHGRRGRLTISQAGLARLRRESAGDAPPHLAQHLDIVGDADRRNGPLRDASESPLAWMARRRDRDGRPLIDAACFEVGERLRRDLTTASLMPRLGADWSGIKVDGGGPRDPSGASDTMLAGRQRVRAALEAVGSDLSGLLIDLCGFLKGLERIEAERRWPARSAKVVAKIALARLAEHYGLEREATGPDRARMRIWRG
ncbi:MAG: ATPase [Methylobacterium sp.]|uniref:DUF6456 domain-containing protein n=1 Tax=Methylobacterium sp. TaxID=409 RepID=UPI0025F033AE|nr:DUF6456 domain-containing protein [Methylobacterium sp.]MBX9932249.1 ATPase [Methylobacterium sp.]